MQYAGWKSVAPTHRHILHAIFIGVWPPSYECTNSRAWPIRDSRAAVNSRKEIIMAKRRIETKAGAHPIGAYSQGVRAGDFIFV